MEEWHITQSVTSLVPRLLPLHAPTHRGEPGDKARVSQQELSAAMVQWGHDGCPLFMVP